MPVYGGANAFAGSGYGTPLQYNSAVSGAITNGTSGTFANKNAGKGALLMDHQNGKLYSNQNTAASPSWTAVGSQS